TEMPVLMNGALCWGQALGHSMRVLKPDQGLKRQGLRMVFVHFQDPLNELVRRGEVSEAKTQDRLREQRNDVPLSPTHRLQHTLGAAQSVLRKQEKATIVREWARAMDVHLDDFFHSGHRGISTAQLGRGDRGPDQRVDSALVYRHRP